MKSASFVDFILGGYVVRFLQSIQLSSVDLAGVALISEVDKSP